MLLRFKTISRLALGHGYCRYFANAPLILEQRVIVTNVNDTTVAILHSHCHDRHVSINYRDSSLSYFPQCDITRNCDSKVKSPFLFHNRPFSTHVTLGQKARRLIKDKFKRKQHFKGNTFSEKTQQHELNPHFIRRPKLKPSLTTQILLGENDVQEYNSLDRKFAELDDMFEFTDQQYAGNISGYESDVSDDELCEAQEIEEVVEPKEEKDKKIAEYAEEIDIDVEHDFPDDVKINPNMPGRGEPNENIPISTTPCSGCGALLHCQNTSIPGYMPSEMFIYFKNEGPEKLRRQKCQRCYMLITHNLALNVSVTADEYKDVIAQVRNVKALVLVVIDVTDMPNSIFPNITALIGKNRPLYIVGNKADLLPQDRQGYLQHIKQVLVQQCEEAGLTTNSNIKHVALISARTGFGIEQLATTLLTDWGRKGHIYILGCTNSGKSTLFNALLSTDMCKSTAMDFIKRATTSTWPGTTLNLLKFPVINPEPWKLARRMTRLKLQKTAEQEQRQFLQMKYKNGYAEGRAKYPTLMGHIGRTFEGNRNMALNVEDSMGWSGPSFSFDTNEGKIVATEKVDLQKMEGYTYDETMYANSRWCYDTPGVVNENQILTLLTQHELAVVLSNKTIIPRSFILKPGQAMHVSGLGRIDYLTGKRSVYLTVFASHSIPVSVRDINEVDDFYKRHIGTNVMGVPLGDAARLAKLPPLIGKNMTLIGKDYTYSVADVILSSLGWVAVTPAPGMTTKLRVYTPGGRGCTLRTPALLPYAIKLRGKRTRGPSYQIKPLRLFDKY